MHTEATASSIVKTVECGMEDLQWKEFLKATLCDTHKYITIGKDYLEIFVRIDKHKNETIFIKCDNPNCSQNYRSNDFIIFFIKSSFKL